MSALESKIKYDGFAADVRRPMPEKQASHEDLEEPELEYAAESAPKVYTSADENAHNLSKSQYLNSDYNEDYNDYNENNEDKKYNEVKKYNDQKQSIEAPPVKKKFRLFDMC